MKNKTILAVMVAASVSAAITACNNSSESSDTFETIAEADIDPAIYEITSGEWHYIGVEDEKFIDMDGLKGLTTYTAEAKPANEGYLRYLGENSEGLHVFDVYDLYGRQFMTLTFVSDEQFYVNGDEENYYVKWDY